MITRRQLLQAGAAAAVAANVRAAESPLRIIDTNLSLFRWPFRRLPLDDADALVKKMRALDISQGWAGSFEAILHRDISSVNERLAKACATRPMLRPIGAINPTLPDWRADLRLCVGHKMPGIRLFPGYHDCKLADPRFAELLQLATKMKLFVQIAATMEDTRTQHPRLRVPDVDLSPLPKALRGIDHARVQILNLRPRSAHIELLAKLPNVRVDTARVEGTDGVPALVRKLPGRVLFGTHAPLLIPEAALIRTHESAQLDAPSLRALLAENADAFARA